MTLSEYQATWKKRPEKHAALPTDLKKHVLRTPQVKVQIEDDRTGMDIETLKRAFLDNLYYIQAKDLHNATPYDLYMALSWTVRDRLLQRWIRTQETYLKQDVRSVCYFSAEYLLGRQLGNALVNVGLYEPARTFLRELGFELVDLMEQENEPGLGNGGLGRLAACFMDSLATLGVPAIGYGIRYEFGIFAQTIQGGWQVEQPDRWLRYGNPWEIPRPEYLVEVKFGGHTEAYTDPQGRYRVSWAHERSVLGTPYDTPVPGYRTNTVNTLRLWSARATEDFDFQVFNAGDFARAVAGKTYSENITKVLYPNDNTYQGKELRLEQQYFFVSCSLQDILRRYWNHHVDLDSFTDKVTIQINDTHPAIGIAELMRLLVDEYLIEWDKAWQITQKVFAYTNHTLLAEALERWPVSLFGRLLPRHLEIIYEINERFLHLAHSRFGNDGERIARLSLIQEGSEKYVRMANLACVGSHAINGVAKLHTELLEQDVLADFYALTPEKFSNKTNGVTPRRFVLLSNPKLALLYTERLGQEWIRDLDLLRKLEDHLHDPDFRSAWKKIKADNKHDLAEYILQFNGIEVDPDSLFDIQVKRIHEYKRQLLMLLYIITLYHRLKHNPTMPLQPRTFIFAGKAAPGYTMAKLIIKCIHSVAAVINTDPDVGGRLKLVFLANFNVSLAQRIYPAADLSEQISTAGKEASGTGNMKFAMGGALTIGTLDGANIEIREQVGPENFFLFGLTAQQVYALKARGYRPYDYYQTNAELRSVIDLVISGHFSPDQPDLFRPLADALMARDEYMLFADYQVYLDCQHQVDAAFADCERWTTMSILNAVRMGYFSSDRSMGEYCRDIWKTGPVAVELNG
ncbi:glycogen/starch/alpha-glucan phosphorylase [Gloeobacter morelensis]|uniref:Alpha-1,4 glucan phosphorylase n=1 Tax=Gloeobacter morelensis MG652769 TaxID=2781736 RepID=A0ABY3PKW6_9CYAN|nr:glycogen/starch/alpha-glucan phosphorylase [Gloeobacter morelensis]UFP94257.1 glycogen/starch/alpha-glucan phosphorylase [Gloeobacter morelensis MG652769]